MKQIKTCEVCGATGEKRNVSHRSDCNMTLCDKHAAQMRKYKRIIDPTLRTIRDKNEIIPHADHAEMIIRNKKNEIVAVTLIDLDDVDKISGRKWNVLPSRDKLYIYSRHPQHIKLHRLILGYYGSKEIDHVNHDTLDNRKANLRIVTRSENASNTDAKHIYRKGNVWAYEIVRYGKRFKKYGFKSYEDAAVGLQKCLESISDRVNELIDQFNIKAANNPFKGVYQRDGKYQAVYYADKQKHTIGTYTTPEEANKAREEYIKNL